MYLKVLRREGGRQVSGSQGHVKTEAEVGVMLLLAGAMSRGMWVASRAGKGQETGSSLEPPEAMQALLTPCVSPSKTHLDF